jgi:hypothetical protein
MTSEHDRNSEHPNRPQPTRSEPEPFRPTLGQRITAWAFIGAFGLTILTVLLTGLWARAPRPHAAADPPGAAIERNDAIEPKSAAPQVPASSEQPQPVPEPADTADERRGQHTDERPSEPAPAGR